jgi:hypothetical protein
MTRNPTSTDDEVSPADTEQRREQRETRAARDRNRRAGIDDDTDGHGPAVLTAGAVLGTVGRVPVSIRRIRECRLSSHRSVRQHDPRLGVTR